MSNQHSAKPTIQRLRFAPFSMTAQGFTSQCVDSGNMKDSQILPAQENLSLIHISEPTRPY